MLDCVGGAPEEVRPERARDEVQERDDARGACGEGGGAGGCGRGAVEEEGEEALAEGVAEGGEAGFGVVSAVSFLWVSELDEWLSWYVFKRRWRGSVGGLGGGESWGEWYRFSRSWIPVTFFWA